MYTVGYGGYYGVALICPSTSIAIVCGIAQILQVFFLILVEIPHMARIYRVSGKKSPE
jgi:phosphatidylethanolamine N-methyltransferase